MGFNIFFLHQKKLLLIPFSVNFLKCPHISLHSVLSPSLPLHFFPLISPHPQGFLPYLALSGPKSLQMRSATCRDPAHTLAPTRARARSLCPLPVLGKNYLLCCSPSSLQVHLAAFSPICSETALHNSLFLSPAPSASPSLLEWSQWQQTHTVFL